MSNETEDIGQRHITLPSVPDSSDYGYDLERILEDIASSGQISDYYDMESIHNQVRSARLSLYRIISGQSDADKEAVILEQKYKRVWNRIYMTTSGTDKIRSTMADIKSESYQNEFLAAQIKVRELSRRAQFLRDELRVLESLANDYRQMIRSSQQ